MGVVVCFFFKQKTAYEVRISDWSSDVCSSDLSKLYVKDLASGVEKKIYDALDQDVQETWAVTGVYPNMAWTPDSRDIVFWAGGKLRRVSGDGGEARIIPFSINDDRVIVDATHPTVEVAHDSFMTKMPRSAEVSPDGRRVVRSEAHTTALQSLMR